MANSFCLKFFTCKEPIVIELIFLHDFYLFINTKQTIFKTVKGKLIEKDRTNRVIISIKDSQNHFWFRLTSLEKLSE